MTGSRLFNWDTQLPDPRIVMGDLSSVVCGTYGYIHLGLGYIDAYVGRFLPHEHPLPNSGPSLQDAGLVGPCNCAGSTSVWVRRPSL